MTWVVLSQTFVVVKRGDSTMDSYNYRLVLPYTSLTLFIHSLLYWSSMLITKVLCISDTPPHTLLNLVPLLQKVFKTQTKISVSFFSSLTSQKNFRRNSSNGMQFYFVKMNRIWSNECMQRHRKTRLHSATALPTRDHLQCYKMVPSLN